MKSCFVFLATLLLFAQPAFAEDEPPPDDLLTPAESTTAESPPAPAPSAEEPEITPTVIAAPPVDTGASLPPPMPAGFGLLNGKAGLGPSLWKESETSSLIPLLRDTSLALTRGALREPALKRLAQKLALTHALQPLGEADEGNDFFEARVMLAAASGNVPDALRLLQRNPAAFGPEAAQRLGGIVLMQGDFTRLCANRNLNAPMPFWQKLSVICALREANHPKAQLMLDLMREAGEPDTLFIELGEGAASGKAQTKAKPKDLLALHVALLALGGFQPTPFMLTLLENNPYPLMLQMKGPPEWRATLLQTLDNSESITAKSFLDHLEGLVLKPEVLEKLRKDPKLLSNEKLIPAALRAAYVLRLTQKEPEGPIRAALLSGLITLTSSRDLMSDLGRAILVLLPVSGPQWVEAAPAFARLALLQNDRAAHSWLALAGKNAAPIYALAAVRHILPQIPRNESLAAYARTSSIPPASRANALALLQALGTPPGDSALAALTALGISLPRAAQDVELDADMKEARKGEALLRLLLLSPSDAISVTLLRIKTLRTMELNREALELALPYF